MSITNREEGDNVCHALRLGSIDIDEMGGILYWLFYRTLRTWMSPEGERVNRITIYTS